MAIKMQQHIIMNVHLKAMISLSILVNRGLLAALSLTLVACGGGGGGPTPAPTAIAQDNATPVTRTISGSVTDSAMPNSQPIADALVKLIQSDGEVTTTSTVTDPEGQFTLVLTDDSDIDPEFLAVSVSAAGFRQKEINVSVDGGNPIAVSSNDVFNYSRPVQLDDGINIGDLYESGLNAERIEKLLDRTLLQSPVPTSFAEGYKELHSLLIYIDGALVVEEYYSGNNDFIDFEGGIVRRRGNPEKLEWSRTDKHYIASVNKSLTASIAGMVLSDYGVSVDAPIATYLPEKNAFFADPNKAALSIHDMMTMQLGFVWNEWSNTDLAQLWASDDFTDFLLSRDNNGPRSGWAYNSASPNMLLRGLESIVQGSIRDWADSNFYSKLGITDYDWQSQPGGLPEGAARMHMRPRDMLKIGITYLNNGVWNNEQVIPAQWVEEISKIQVKSFAGDYSYFFWIRELDGISYISADGDGGQYINIFPEHNMVVVMTQGNYLAFPVYVDQADDIMSNFIFPALPVTPEL